MIFCPHHWSTYHVTEVRFWDGTDPVLREFQVCQTCKARRCADIPLKGKSDEHADCMA